MFNIALPLAGTTVWAPGIVVLGFAIGFLTGMFGAGGGFILTPFLRIVFDIPYPIAVGSSLVQILVNASFSAWRHWRNRSVDLALGAIASVGAVCGTEVGVQIQARLDIGAVAVAGRTLDLLDLVMNSLFLVLMLAVGISIVRETARSGGEETRTRLAVALQHWRVEPMLRLKRSGIGQMSLWVPLALSFCVGILTGLMGVGGGFVNFPMLVYIIGVPTLVAVGTSAFQIVFASAYGAFRHAHAGHVEVVLVGLLVLGSVVGVQLGVRVSHIVGGRGIRKLFSLVLLAGVLLVLWDIVR